MPKQLEFNTITEVADHLEDVHGTLLFGDMPEVTQLDHSTFAVHYYLDALATIESAKAKLRLAVVTLAKEKAGG